MGQPPRLSGTVLACLLLFFAVAESTGKCKVGCHGMHTSKAYQEGHTYVYNLNGLSVTSVTNAQGDATLKLSATVELSVKSDCLHQLRLKNVQLNGTPPSTPDVEQYAVQFNYHNGHIDTELCTEPGDSQASLNIKRAVVSMFQSAIMQDGGTTTHHETDVMGACPTDFSFRKEGDSLIVYKNRNLAECAFRENVNQGLISASSDTMAGIKSAPLLASHQEIEQRFKRGVLNKAMTTEVYQLRPFSNGNSGAKTVVETTLTLKSEKSDSPTAAVSQPKSLIFEAPHPVLKSSVSAINNALKAAKAQVSDGVKPETASKFADLVKVVRLCTKNDILSVYQKVRGKEDQKLLLDAICLAGSGEAAEVAVELIKNKEVTGIQALFFYTSLALVRHVNLPSVVAVTSLLDQPNVPQNFRAYLGVGHIIGKYCQDHPCENVPEVKEAVHKIREKVGNGKAKTREDENRVIFALKALGNTQYLDDATLQKLANIGADKNVRTRVRVAALEALPTRCSMKWKNILFKVLADREEDSEVRIKAYLSLVACPCQHVAEHLKEILSKETVNQIGSFIQSHLRNLRASTDPNKQDAKNHLGLIKPRTKFPEDIRKFSFNNELSYNADALGLGSTLESNVIYSQNSFVPRSTNLNLTVELFGRSFNFLDLTARVENLDRVIEHYFGPKGKLWEHDMGDIMDADKSTVNKIGKYITERYEKSMRGKREVRQGDLDRFAKNVRLRDNEVDESLDLDFSMKLFGVELALLSYQGDNSKLNPEAIIDKIFDNLDKNFDIVKNLNYDLENYLQFLEAELVYPTSLGSALTLGLTGTSAVRVKTNAKIDIPAIFKNPKNAAIKIALEPSVSINVVGNMIVQGLGAESGMKIVNTLHTATSTDISVNMLDGNGIDIKIGIPKKKQELISLSSEVLLSNGPKENKYIAPKFEKGKEYADCFNQLSNLLGVTVCGQISYPYEDLSVIQKKPMFPLSGPAKFAVTVENNDVTSYNFKIYLNTQDPKKRSFEILFDTPKSKTNRRVSLIAEAGLEPNKYAKISLDSPIKKASVEAVLKNNPQERTLTISALHDQAEYFGRIGVLASGNKYTPVLEYSVPKHIEKLATAKTGLKVGQQYSMQGTVDVTDYKGGQKFVLDKVSLVSNDQKVFVIDGFVIWTPNALTVDTNIDYTDKNLVFKVDGKKVTDNNYMFIVSAMPSIDPNIGFKLEWEFKREVGASLKNKVVFTHGKDTNSKLNRLHLEQKINYNYPKNFFLSMSNELTYPVMNLKLKFNGKLTPKLINSDIEVKYETFKFGTELSAEMNIEKPGDYEVEAEMELMENKIKLKAKRAVLDDHESKYTNSLVLSPGGKYDADATVTYDVSKNKINVQLDGDLNLDGKKVKVNTGLVTNQQTVNARVFVKIDNVKYVEFVLNTRRSPNPHGSLSLNLKDYLTATGQYTNQNGKENANLNIDVPKINRKIKANGDLAVSGSEYVGNFEILYDAEKDPSKRIKLSTISDITKTSIDTKNVLEVRNCKIELNGKGTLKGTFNDGQLQMNVGLTLPNGRFLIYKLQRNSVKKDDKYDIQVDVELTDSVEKGGESQKITYSTDAKDVDPQLLTFQINSQLKFVGFDGKDVQIAWDGKRLKQNDKKLSNYNVKLSGARIPNKFQLHVGWDLGEKQGTYVVKSSLGDNLAMEGKTNFVLGNGSDKPDEIEGVLYLILPSEKLRNLKLDSKLLLGRSECKHALKLTYNDQKTIKMETDLKTNELNELEESKMGKLTLNVLELPPLVVGGSYKYNLAEEKKTASLDLNFNYSDMKFVLQFNTEDLPNLIVANINAEYNLNLEKLRKVEVQFVKKIQKLENRWETNTVVLADDIKYTLKSEIQQQNVNSLFHVEATYPSGKAEILSKVQKLGPKEYIGEWKVNIPTGFVVLDAHVDLVSIDDFVINANFDSHIRRNIHVEIANKPTAKTGKRIVITVTGNGQNIVTGSTNYKKRDEDGKIVVEGNGSLKIGDNTRSSSFKYTRQQLTRDKDGEVGVAVILNANFGPSAIVGELKLSNKEIHVFQSYCEQNKDCAHFKLQSTLDTKQKNMLTHQITVEVDLKKFDVPAEFGLKTSTELKATTFDHITNLYLHSTKDKSEYTYQVYVHPKEAATILTLPSREMAVILTYDLPKTKHTGAYKLDLSLYLDRKNKASDKTSLTASGDFNVDKNSLSFSGETKFTYPAQPKDMIVKGRLHYGGEHLLDVNLNIDVFAKKSQKVTIIANLQRQELLNGNNMTSVIEVNSSGQQLKLDLKSHLTISSKELGFGSFFTYNDVHQKPKTMGVLFSADVNHYNLLAMLPDKELIKDELTMQFSNNSQKVNRELSLMGETPEVTTFESDMNGFKFLKYPKDNPNNKLSVNSQIVLGQLAEIHADTYKDGTKKELFHVLVNLDEKQFLKADFGYNKENVAEALDDVKNKNVELLKKLKDVQTYVMDQVQVEVKDLLEHLKKAQPNMKPLLVYYQTELNKLKVEINADETVKEIEATLNKYFGAVVTIVTKAMKEVAECLEKLQKQVNTILLNLKTDIKDIYTQLKASYDKIFHELVEILDAVAKLAITFLNAILNMINEHQKELQDFMSVISDMTQDFAKVLSKMLDRIKHSLEEFNTLLMNQLKAPSILMEKIEQLKKLPEAIACPIKELCIVLEGALPTQELRQFLNVTCQHIVKLIKHEKVDEVIEFKKIYSRAEFEVQYIINFLQTQETWHNVLDFVQVPIYLDLNQNVMDILSKLPGISTLRISILNLLRSGELATPLDLYYTYRPTLYPSDIVPPFSKSAVVADGGHFFTFDGRHLTLPGTCTYILAQDMQDGNFSVVANFNNGALISITVTEPKESITLKNNGNILVHNKPTDFPANTKNLHAYLYQLFTNVKSDYGVHVACSKNAPMICSVHVSGFYLGKLRGLFGDGNNEPYDDYTLPSGKITESATEFGNAYKLKGDCPVATAVEHKERAPVCTEYFSGQATPLGSCFNYVNPTQYREGCDHAVAANIKDGACLIAAAYHYACYAAGIKGTHVPPSCSKCITGANTVDIGDSFSVKVPKKEADIIFVVEQETPNEKIFKELVTPLMSELRDELKHHEMTDVHIGLIGFSEKMKWPQHYTLNGNTNINGEVKTMKFHEKKPTVTFDEAKEGNTEKKISYLRQRLDVELGTIKLNDAYEEAIRYPFRPGAATAVIGVLANPCEKSPLLLSLQQIKLLLGQKTYRDLGLTYYHMSFPNELLVSNKPQKNIVGYDEESVYTFADSKKKPLSGCSDMKSNLVASTTDVCADFALSSSGATFSLNNFLDAKPNQKKQFIQVAARRIADGLANLVLEKDCSCDFQFGIAGRPRCKIVGRREKEPLARHTKGGVKG